MGFSSYFLIIFDFIQWSKDNDVPVGPGRGSGAVSVVTYSLGITTLDRIDHGFLFKRFLNQERISMQDCDIDFCMEKRDSVISKNCAVIFDDDLHDMSLQGPVAVDFLQKHVPGIRDLAYFGIMQTKLFGCPVMISRTGYTGERGYEIFCGSKNAIHLWDSILSEGASMGIVPVQFSTLDLLRTESYLLFYPGDNSETYPFDDETCGDTLWELGLEFTVSPGKTGFIGAENHYASEGKERFFSAAERRRTAGTGPCATALVLFARVVENAAAREHTVVAVVGSPIVAVEMADA